MDLKGDEGPAVSQAPVEAEASRHASAINRRVGEEPASGSGEEDDAEIETKEGGEPLAGYPYEGEVCSDERCGLSLQDDLSQGWRCANFETDSGGTTVGCFDPTYFERHGCAGDVRFYDENGDSYRSVDACAPGEPEGPPERPERDEAPSDDERPTEDPPQAPEDYPGLYRYDDFNNSGFYATECESSCGVEVEHPSFFECKRITERRFSESGEVLEETSHVDCVHPRFVRFGYWGGPVPERWAEENCFYAYYEDRERLATLKCSFGAGGQGLDDSTEDAQKVDAAEGIEGTEPSPGGGGGDPRGWAPLEAIGAVIFDQGDDAKPDAPAGDEVEAGAYGGIPSEGGSRSSAPEGSASGNTPPSGGVASVARSGAASEASGPSSAGTVPPPEAGSAPEGGTQVPSRKHAPAGILAAKMTDGRAPFVASEATPREEEGNTAGGTGRRSRVGAESAIGRERAGAPPVGARGYSQDGQANAGLQGGGEEARQGAASSGPIGRAFEAADAVARKARDIGPRGHLAYALVGFGALLAGATFVVRRRT